MADGTQVGIFQIATTQLLDCAEIWYASALWVRGAGFVLKAANATGGTGDLKC